MNRDLSRREWIACGVAAAAGCALAPAMCAAETDRPKDEPFGYCLNTSTISGQNLDLVEVVEIAAKAGFQSIEPWINALDAFVRKGGNLKDLGQRIRDRGLTVESAIGFFEWIVDDPDRRAKAFEEAKRNMDLLRRIGGKRLAAPPVGATNISNFDLLKAAERYRALLELGDQMDVVPEAELWGFSRTLGRIGEVMFVAIESGHPKACILLDVFHLYKGGSNFTGLKLLGGTSMHVLHFNDYPANPPRNAISDAQRIYPGDGVAPLKNILNDLRQIGFKGVLSLELFNRDYWKQDALTVAKTGLEKMRAVVKNSFA